MLYCLVVGLLSLDGGAVARLVDWLLGCLPAGIGNVEILGAWGRYLQDERRSREWASRRERRPKHWVNKAVKLSLVVSCRYAS